MAVGIADGPGSTDVAESKARAATPTGIARTMELALRAFFDRAMTLAPESRSSLAAMIAEMLGGTLDAEDFRYGMDGLVEILEAAPLTSGPMDLDAPMPEDLKAHVDRVGARIKAEREAAGLNQTELAERSGLTQSHVSRLERGEHSPTMMTLEKIAKALAIDVERFSA